MNLTRISVLVWFICDPGEPILLKAGPGNQVSSWWMNTDPVFQSLGTECPLLPPPRSGSFTHCAAKILVQGRGVGSFSSQGWPGTAQWQHFCCLCVLLMSPGLLCTGTALVVQPGHPCVYEQAMGDVLRGSVAHKHWTISTKHNSSQCRFFCRAKVTPLIAQTKLSIKKAANHPTSHLKQRDNPIIPF